jgi:hypothetical protein
MAQTKGEYRVGVTFNPSQSSIVDDIKAKAAELIDLIENIPASNRDDNGSSEARAAEVGRLKALAQTKIEEAAMWGVKAATKPERI